MNIAKLKGKTIENGMTIPKLAEAISVERSSLYRRLNKGKITVGEARKIKEVLQLSDSDAVEIFLS